MSLVLMVLALFAVSEFDAGGMASGYLAIILFITVGPFVLVASLFLMVLMGFKESLKPVITLIIVFISIMIMFVALAAMDVGIVFKT